MCTNPNPPWPAWDGSFDYGYQTLVERIEKVKEKIKSDGSIYLTGGEPTLHPQFLNILEHLSKNFPKQKITLLTNGRRFVYKDFTKKVLATNNDFDIDVSLHGPGEFIHDKITNTADSFKQTVEGLKNLLFYKKRQNIGIRFVITKLSYKYIKQFLKMVEGRFPSIDKVIFIFWEPEGQAIKNLKAVKVKYTQVGRHLEEIHSLLGNLKEIRFYHFPLCAIPEKFWPNVWRTLNANEVDFVKKCHTCFYKKYCLGIHKGYLKYVGNEEFLPPEKQLKIRETDNIYRPIGEIDYYL
jgi:MoaA/NifB/PqqE/SkfB family radical SAM enzyme